MKTIKRVLRWFDNDRNACVLPVVMAALTMLVGETHDALVWMCLGILFLVLSYVREIHAAIIGGIEIKFRIEEEKRE